MTYRSALPRPWRAPGRRGDADRQHSRKLRSRQMTTPGQYLLHHIRHLRRVVALASLVLLAVEGIRPVVGQPVQLVGVVIGATAIILFAVYESYRSIAAYIRAADRRESELATAARLDGASLAASTFQHRIGNKLAVTVGYGEMLADDPRLPSDLKAQAHDVLSSAMAAAAVVHTLDNQLVRIELDRSVAGPEVLDINASTRIDEQPPNN